MDALGLQAALVKLDPATTVTPIGSSVKMMSRHRPSFGVEVDETDLTLRNVLNNRDDEKTPHHHHHHHHHQKSIGGSSTETSSSGQSSIRKLQIGSNEADGSLTSSTVATVLPSGASNHQNNHKNSSSSSTSSSQKIGTSKRTISEVR